MTWKPESAYHEAGHALLAHLSCFHVVGPINLKSGGDGGLIVGLSRSKCLAAGKAVGEATKRDAEVARDLAVILVGGLAAEQIAADADRRLRPSAQAAALDHALLVESLAGARLSRKFDRYEAAARAILKEHWPSVDALARLLLRNGGCSIDAAEAIFRAEARASRRAQ